jgi:hypothetical protein
VVWNEKEGLTTVTHAWLVTTKLTVGRAVNHLITPFVYRSRLGFWGPFLHLRGPE